MTKFKKWLTEKKLKAQGWISVKDRMPEEKPENITFQTRDIGSGEIVETEEIMVQRSEIVSVICKRCLYGEFEVFEDIDATINGCWMNNIEVTHWKPRKDTNKAKEN